MKDLRAKSDLSYKQQIAHWLPYLDSLENCSSANDSVVAYLNKKIGFSITMTMITSVQ
jgi:hypothetical protein